MHIDLAFALLLFQENIKYINFRQQVNNDGIPLFPVR